MYESDRLGSDYLGNHVYLLKKKKACGTNLGTHEHFEYGKRKKKGRRLKLLQELFEKPTSCSQSLRFIIIKIIDIS